MENNPSNPTSDGIQNAATNQPLVTGGESKVKDSASNERQKQVSVGAKPLLGSNRVKSGDGNNTYVQPGKGSDKSAKPEDCADNCADNAEGNDKCTCHGDGNGKCAYMCDANKCTANDGKNKCPVHDEGNKKAAKPDGKDKSAGSSDYGNNKNRSSTPDTLVPEDYGKTSSTRSSTPSTLCNEDYQNLPGLEEAADIKLNLLPVEELFDSRPSTASTITPRDVLPTDDELAESLDKSLKSYSNDTHDNDKCDQDRCDIELEVVVAQDEDKRRLRKLLKHEELQQLSAASKQ